MQTVSLGGNVYFVSFIDDYSQKVSVYFMWHKHLKNSPCGKLKWKTKQGGRSNASGQIMAQSTQTPDS